MYNIYFLEWPLILFTIFAQLTAGLAFALKIYQWKNYSNYTLEEMKPIFLVFSILMIISLTFSCFHLSNVFSGYYTIGRICSNWLPLEVFSLAGFAVISLLIYILILMHKASRFLVGLALNLLVLLAIIGLIAMSGIYGSMSITVVSWNFKYVALLFFIATIMLGGLALPLFSSLNEEKYNISYKMSLIGFLLFVVVLPLYMVYLGKTQPYNLPNIFDYAPMYSCFLSIGLVLTIIGFGMMLYRGCINANNIKYVFIFVFIGQLVLRILFYSLINTHLM